MTDASAAASVAVRAQRARYEWQPEGAEDGSSLFDGEPIMAARRDDSGKLSAPRRMNVIEVPEQTGRFCLPAGVRGNPAERAHGVFRKPIGRNSFAVDVQRQWAACFAHHARQDGFLLPAERRPALMPARMPARIALDCDESTGV